MSIPISVSAGQTLLVENRIIDFLQQHFQDTKNWYQLQDVARYVYRVPKIKDFYNSGKFKDVSSTVFLNVQRAMVRTGRIYVFNCALFTKGIPFPGRHEKRLVVYMAGGAGEAERFVYLAPHLLDMSGVLVTHINAANTEIEITKDEDFNLKDQRFGDYEAFGPLYSRSRKVGGAL